MRWVLLVLAALILLAVWIGAILVPDLRVVAEWTTAAIVFLAISYVLIGWAIKRIKADAMEKEITKAPPEDARRPEVAELIAQMQRGFAALRAARRSKSAVYEIPWYVIVGPPGAGKTTALQQSGLTFVADAQGSPKVRGLAGTRNCDWWLSPEAVLLDTAGRYASGGEDHEEWLAFLDSLVRLRPDRPVDGLMVAVGVADIASATEDQRAELAGRLRARLAEIVDRLEMVAPVYLVMTKADLIAGFAESMSYLSKAERGQVWGASFAVDDPRLGEPGRAVGVEIDRLAHSLHARLLDRLPLERDSIKCGRLLQLPLELAGLAPALSQFADALFKPSAVGEHLVFRGFYLTSGTQVGQPVDRAVSDMARGLGQGQPSPHGDLQSYFLTDLFRSIMLPDRHLAVRSAAAVQRGSRRELRAALVAVVVAAFFLVPATVSYVRNVQVANAADAVARLPGMTQPGTRADPVEALDDLVGQVEHETDGLSVPGWFGPRAAKSLLHPVAQAYLGRLNTELLAHVRPELDRRLHDVAATAGFADAPTSPDAVTPLSAAYETVKLYTMLVTPARHVDPPWAATLIARIWEGAIPVSDAVPTERLVEHARRYLEALASGDVPAWAVPANLRGARERLRRSDVRGLPYRRTLLAAADVPPLRASEMFGAASLEFLDCRGDVQIPGPFTAAGWEKVRGALDAASPWSKGAVVEQWVVDDADVASDEAGLRAQVRGQYFEDYVRHWMAFLDELRVRTPPDLTAARAELRALKE
ncbi:MAG: type VI secretion system membrane subunit TssM, partial [Polyangiaceae bacterium]